MIIYVIFAQRKCNYPGEYAPEVLDACDEYAWDENPKGWIEERISHHRKDSSFESVQCVPVSVSDDAVMAILMPSAKPIEGTVQP